ncbi:hypothetical protein T12_4152 [Trichinella patagoniensis]|uniref:Biopterin-dependent aromatic amino acid hydroxylase family profile domain-containing protein n=1 Tax=Trichinella patagoniensis TaxID=990121 RepID=A0A0V1ABJ6_9BILA|nr:hypothetical protein T12_4152 [Trichinella patagoniensis]
MVMVKKLWMKTAEKDFNVVKLVKSGQQHNKHTVQEPNLERTIASHAAVLAETVFVAHRTT